MVPDGHHYQQDRAGQESHSPQVARTAPRSGPALPTPGPGAGGWRWGGGGVLQTLCQHRAWQTHLAVSVGCPRMSSMGPRDGVRLWELGE